MEQLIALKKAIERFSLLLVFACSVAGIITSLVLVSAGLPLFVVALLSLLVVGIASFLAANVLAARAIEPGAILAQAVLHVSRQQHDVPAPDMSTIHNGRQLLADLTAQIYQFASQQNSAELIAHRMQLTQAATIVNRMPLPLFVLNKQQQVVNASNSGLEYCRVESSQIFGKPIFDGIKLEFPSERTLEAWMNECQATKATDTAYWQRVRVKFDDNVLHQCDIAAYYSKDSSSGTDFIITMFDRTDQYNEEDQDLSFVAIAVHELRTPLTMLRGYIEVFEDELSGKLGKELEGFLHKMRVSAQQLGSFFNNILNVARVEQNQLELKLMEGNWGEILTSALEDLQLKAQVHNHLLEISIADNLPAVGVDRVSIVEVLNNLIDNAIKYTRTGEHIQVNTYVRPDGMIETTVVDHGIGIPTSVMPNLFSKFYRNHRVSKSVGGTGLGLYLSKSIVDAHGGEIWVKSKEGEGATFGFTLLPFDRLAAEQKNGDNDGITRGAHGWIKNHSLYRR